MKQQISPAVIAVAIVVVLAIVGFVGYKVMVGSGKNGTGTTGAPPPEAQKYMDPGKSMGEHYRPSTGPPAGYNGGMPGSAGRQ